MSLGRASFLCLKIRFLVYSDESLRMIGQVELPFLAGRAKTFVTRRWKGGVEEGVMSPQAVAESRHGLMISRSTISGMAVEGVVGVMGRPRIRSDVAREAC